MKPMLASDADESKLIYTLGLQPKIDGVRALNMTGVLTGRSLKQHANRYTTALYSTEEYLGFDGELAAAHECAPDLCRMTTSLVSRIGGEPFTLWHVFDYVTSMTKVLPYAERYRLLKQRVKDLQDRSLGMTLRVVPMTFCCNHTELLFREENYLERGYEGVIIRGLDSPHKEGRSTVREGGLLRLKRFIEEDAVVIGLEEGQTNTNEAQTNELGNQFRSSHQDNMIPNGQIGAFICRALKDVFDPYRKDVKLIAKDQIIKVSPGCMPHDQRIYYFSHQSKILGQVIKYKFFPKGIKDKPRFPTYQSHRALSDIS